MQMKKALPEVIECNRFSLMAGSPFPLSDVTALLGRCEAKVCYRPPILEVGSLFA
jgi:hypothetical protein